MPAPRILIAGGSFGGLETLRHLRRRSKAGALDITLIDRAPVAGYVPLAHEALHAGLPRPAAVELAAAAEDLGARFVCAEIAAIDSFARRVLLTSGVSLEGDVIVVALGSTLRPPDELEGGGQALSHKSAAALLASQRALAERKGRPTEIVVIGGGLTGAELAAELGWQAMRGGDSTTVRLLGRSPPGACLSLGAQRRLHRQLLALGVSVETGRAARIEPGVVHLEDGQELPADLAFWAGGIRPSPAIAGVGGVGRTAAGFLRADEQLRLLDDEGHPIPGMLGCGDAVQLERAGERIPAMHGRVLEPYWQAPIAATNALVAAAELGPKRAVSYRPRESFAHGVSLGNKVLIADGRVSFFMGRSAQWGRRRLGRWWAERFAGAVRPTTLDGVRERPKDRDERELALELPAA